MCCLAAFGNKGCNYFCYRLKMYLIAPMLTCMSISTPSCPLPPMFLSAYQAYLHSSSFSLKPTSIKKSFWVTKSCCPQYTLSVKRSDLNSLPLKVGELAASQNCLHIPGFFWSEHNKFQGNKKTVQNCFSSVLSLGIHYLWVLLVYVFGLFLIDAWILAWSGLLVLMALQRRRIDKLQAL